MKTEDDLMSELNAQTGIGSIIMVAGVGGAGSNAVNHMWDQGIHGVRFMVCNTDQQALDISPVELKVRLGTDGLGAGNDPERGRHAAIESLPEIRRQFEEAGTRMLFLTAGMGGGTGTGASPVIAKLAHEMGILTVAIVTLPLTIEGPIRYEQALQGIDNLRENVDSLLIINNENIIEMYGKLSLKQAFGKADDILGAAAKGISEIITLKSDNVNIDFADVSKVMRGSGRAHMAVATAEGEDRAELAAEASLHSPLLDNYSITGAKYILVNVSVADSDTLQTEEAMRALNYIGQHACMQDEHGRIQKPNIIWGTSTKPELGNALELVVVATGFGEEADMRTPVSAPVLTPIKPGKNTAQRPSEQVISGTKSNKYSKIDQLLNTPAYQARNAQFIVKPTGRKAATVLQTPDKERTPEQQLFGTDEKAEPKE